MVAKITALFSNLQIRNDSRATDVNGVNDVFVELSTILESLSEKFTSKGLNMQAPTLKKATSLTDVVSVTNENITLINQFLYEMNSTLEESYLLKKEVLEISGIDVINTDGTTNIVVENEKISLTLSNGQFVNISSSKITSEKGDETLEIIHG